MNTFRKKLLENQVFQCFALAIIVNLLIEVFSRRSLIQGLKYMVTSPHIFLYDVVIIMFTLSFALFFKKRIFALAIISVVWLAGGITNGVILSCRVTPFTAIDFRLISDAIAVADTYITPLNVIMGIAGVAAVVFILVMMFRKIPSAKNKYSIKKSLVVVAAMGAIVMGSTSYGTSTGMLATTFGNIADAYLEYGFVYCFSNSVLNTGIDKPKTYSEETITEIVTIENNDKEVTTSSETNATQNPNVIFIQLESFFDVTRLSELSFSQDPIPNFRKLMENYSGGYVSVPSVGAGTANTEFEIITGMNLDFFGPGEYPYKTVLQDTTCESMANNLEELGYTSHAIHNNDGTFYSRNLVFSNLGFSSFTPIEYMGEYETTQVGWAKDYILTSEIMETLTSTEGNDYIYTITTQSHGSYYQKFENPVITVDGIDDEYTADAYEYYVNQLYEVDQFVGALVDAVNTLDEDTVIVFYGDHLPTLGIEESDLSDGDLFQIDYVIYSNFDMAREDRDLEAYQLSSYVLSRLGISTSGVIENYHRAFDNDSTIEEQTYLDNLELLQYDVLYGDLDAYDGVNPYEASDIQMGIHTIKIDSINKDNTEEYTVNGENFTQYSYVFVNGKQKDTEYVDSTTLKVTGCDISADDEVTVSQIGDDKEVLSTTEVYIY